MPAKVISIKQFALDQAVREIHRQFANAIEFGHKTNSARLLAGSMLLELRARIEAGEAGEGVNWWAWYESKFVRSRKDAEKVMRLASAEDPEQAAEDEREETRERVADLRKSDVENDGAYVRSNRNQLGPVDRLYNAIMKLTDDQQEELKELLQW